MIAVFLVIGVVAVVLFVHILRNDILGFTPSGIELVGEIVEINYKTHSPNSESARYYPIVAFEYNNEHYELESYRYYIPKDCPSPGEKVRFEVNKKFNKVMILNLVVPAENNI